MTTDRIKEIQEKTAYPNSVSVQQALLQVWNECEQDMADKKYTEEDIRKVIDETIKACNISQKEFYGDLEIDTDKIINSLNKQDNEK
jgi:hypothetical protein